MPFCNNNAYSWVVIIGSLSLFSITVNPLIHPLKSLQFHTGIQIRLAISIHINEIIELYLLILVFVCIFYFNIISIIIPVFPFAIFNPSYIIFLIQLILDQCIGKIIYSRPIFRAATLLLFLYCRQIRFFFCDLV